MQRRVIELSKSEGQPWIYLGQKNTQQISICLLEDISMLINQDGAKLL